MMAGKGTAESSHFGHNHEAGEGEGRAPPLVTLNKAILLILPKQVTNWGPVIQMCEPMGTVVIQTTTLIQLHVLFFFHQN